MLTEENVAFCLQVCDAFNVSEVMKECLTFVDKNIYPLMEKNRLINLPARVLQMIFQRNTLAVDEDNYLTLL